MHAKDFDEWNKHKKATNALTDYLPLYRERQVRWCRLGVNVGFEQDGTGKEFSRPVLILKGFSRHACLVVPLTTSKKRTSYHIPLGTIAGREASVLISQLRLVDTRRLDMLVETLGDGRYQYIRKAVKDML